MLNALLIINQSFYKRAFEIFNPRNSFYISRNDGLFENDVNHQKDTLINANSLIELGQHIYNDADYSNFERLKQKWG